MSAALTDALARLPRKGKPSWPFAGGYFTSGRPKPSKWYVAANLHEWALAHGYLTGAVFKRTRGKTKTSFQLLLVGPCPWSPGHLRYYTTSLPSTLTFETAP